MCWIGTFGNPSWTVAWPFIAMFMVFKLAMWAAIVTMVVCGIRWLRREQYHGASMGPVEILKSRYARGELLQAGLRVHASGRRALRTIR